MCDRTFTTRDIVCKFIGEIVPVGDSCIDYARLDNLRVAVAVVNDLLRDIMETAAGKDSHMASVKKAGAHASEYLANVREDIHELLEVK